MHYSLNTDLAVFRLRVNNQTTVDEVAGRVRCIFKWKFRKPYRRQKKSSTKSLQTTVHVRIQDAVGGDRAQWMEVGCMINNWAVENIKQV